MTELVRSVASGVIDTPSVLCRSVRRWVVKICRSFFRLCLVVVSSWGLQTQAKFSLSPSSSPFDFDETALGMGVEIFVRCVENFVANTSSSFMLHLCLKL